MMDWAVLCSDFQRKATPPFRDSPEGGMVLNEFSIQGNTTYVVLPNRGSDSFNDETVTIDTNDLQKMDEATDGFWRYSAPCEFPPGPYLPQDHNHREIIGLARFLLGAPHGTWRAFRDGDPLNCRRSNIVIKNKPPLQRDWLWNALLPDGFTEVRRSENYIMVKAGPGADNRLMWQYLLERWQFVRSRNITLTIPRTHTPRTSFTRRISAIIQSGGQCASFDIGDNGVRENYRCAVRETAREAA